MVGLFNLYNFNVHSGPSSVELSKQAKISCSKLDYGKKILHSNKPAACYMEEISSSFGSPSFTIENVNDGPVDCWVITSLQENQIIYIEFWKDVSPQRFYIFLNAINNITSSFIRHLYEKVQ